jgi:hypothetical protein
MNRFRAMLLVAVACSGFTGCGGNSSVQGAAPEIQLSKMTLFFGANFGLPFDPEILKVNVTNSGAGTLSFTAVSDSPWLTVTPGNGTAPNSLGIKALLGNLTVGTYTGHVTVASAGAQGSPATITVTFVVAPSPANTFLGAVGRQSATLRNGRRSGPERCSSARGHRLRSVRLAGAVSKRWRTDCPLIRRCQSGPTGSSTRRMTGTYS